MSEMSYMDEDTRGYYVMFVMKYTHKCKYVHFAIVTYLQN